MTSSKSLKSFLVVAIAIPLAVVVSACAGQESSPGAEPSEGLGETAAPICTFNSPTLWPGVNPVTWTSTPGYHYNPPPGPSTYSYTRPSSPFPITCNDTYIVNIDNTVSSQIGLVETSFDKSTYGCTGATIDTQIWGYNGSSWTQLYAYNSGSGPKDPCGLTPIHIGGSTSYVCLCAFPQVDLSTLTPSYSQIQVQSTAKNSSGSTIPIKVEYVNN